MGIDKSHYTKNKIKKGKRKKLKIINITSSHFTTTSFVHHIIFEVDAIVFEAYVYEDKNETYVKFCFESLTKKAVDIPEYFGKGFSSKVFSLIYDSLEDNFTTEFKEISQTEAGKILGKTKEEVHNMVLNGVLKNYGNESRFMVNEFEVKKLLKGAK